MCPTTVLKTMKKARGLVKCGWNRLTFAKDKHGNEIYAYSRHAVSWCANGALMAAAGCWFNYVWVREIIDEYVDEHTDVPCLAVFNISDGVGQAEVIRLYDDVIEWWERKIK